MKHMNKLPTFILSAMLLSPLANQDESLISPNAALLLFAYFFADQGGEQAEVDVGRLEMGGIGFCQMMDQCTMRGLWRRYQGRQAQNLAGSVNTGQQSHGG